MRLKKSQTRSFIKEDKRMKAKRNFGDSVQKQ